MVYNSVFIQCLLLNLFLCQHLCVSISNSAKYMECDTLKFTGATLHAINTVPHSG